MKIKINFPLLLVLLGVILLRLPSLFEPHWYGDEEIYLAIGQAVNRGAVLYRDIWDNKTPLLYLIYSASPTILWAKLTASVFVVTTCLGIYFLAKKFFISSQSLNLRWQIVLPLFASGMVGVFLSIPLLEGTIANAELYFTTAIVWSVYIIFTFDTAKNNFSKTLLLGLFLSFAFYIKVPAVFDFVGIFLYLFIFLFDLAKTPKFPFISRYAIVYLVKKIFTIFTPIILVFSLLTAITFAYFYFNHAIGDFLTASFSQNAAYVSVDTGPLAKLSNPLFVKGFVLLLTLLTSLVFFIKKMVSKELFLLTLWFGFSLYGALLSGRPYMHYLLQIIPPLTVLLVYVFANFKKYWWILAPFFLIFFYLYKMFLGAFALPTIPYYQNFLEFTLKEKSWENYTNFFDGRTLNSYHLGDYLVQNTDDNDPIFVWGDAASIYVISQRPPATKFIQAHHLTTIDPINYKLIIQRLETVQPKFIIVSRPTFAFPQLEALLVKNYKEVRNFDYLHVYQIKKTNLSSSWSINY